MNDAPLPGSIQLISRAATILRALDDTPVSLGTIAARTGLPRSTVQRIVDALAIEHLVEAGSGGVRLAWGMREIAERASSDIVSLARPALETLFARTRETVDISTRIGSEVSFLDRIVSDQELRVVPFPDKPRPLHAMANGKALLSLLDEAGIARLYGSDLPRLTPNTIQTLPALLDELAKVRAGGFAYDREEHALGVCAVGIAVPARGRRHHALSVVVPAARFEQARPTLEAALRQCRDAIIAALAERPCRRKRGS